MINSNINIDKTLSHGVYLITCLNSKKIYVGSTIQKFQTRWNVHKSNLKSGNHPNRYLQNSWDKHGEDPFTFEILEHSLIAEKVVEREQYYIDTLNCCDREVGYNLSALANRVSIAPYTERDRFCKVPKGRYGYVVTCPSGLDLYVSNLSAFAEAWSEEYKLSVNCLSNNSLGKTKQHRGFKVKICLVNGSRATKKSKVWKKANPKTRPISHIVFSPEGVRYKVSNLAAFCKEKSEYGISASALSSCAAGRHFRCGC